MRLVNFIPRPARDIVVPPVRAIARLDAVELQWVLPYSAKAAIRTAIAVGLIVAAVKLGGSALLVGGVVAGGTLVSLPAVVIAAGGVLTYCGLNAAIGAVASGSLMAFVSGIGAAAVGWYLLENHTYSRFGILE